MTVIKKIFPILLFVAFHLNSMGQHDVIRNEVDSLEYKPWQIKRLGKQADKINDYYSAIDYFLIYTELKPEKKRYQYMLAELYREARDYTTAMELYAKIYEEVPEQFPKALYWHGIMKIMSEANYAEAKTILEDFEDKYKATILHDKILKKIFKVQLEGTELAPKLIENPLDVIITHLDTSINKAHAEFSPFMYGENKFIYGSLKQEGIQYYSTDTTTKIPTRKFYIAEREYEDWKGINKELEGPFNSDEINIGNGIISTDRKRFYFTRCEQNVVLKKVICSIYESHIDSTGGWSEPKMMESGINDPNYTTSHPTLGVDPKTGAEALYFSSDRDRGKGGLDLWYTYYNPKKDEWKSPKNVSSLNSIGDEITPFYDIDTRTMYFSSTSYPGMGGLDIFKATGQLSKFTDPVNAGVPINSNVDDLDFAIAPSEEEGFFVSNRIGGVSLINETCCDDIYHFLFTKYLKIFVAGKLYEERETKQTDSINYGSNIDSTITSNNNDTTKIALANNVVNSSTQDVALTDAVITLFLVDDKTGEKIELKTNTTDSIGEYLIKLEQGNSYEIEFSKPGYFKLHKTVSTKNITESDTLVLESLRLKKIPMEPIVVKNIYYPFDKAHLTDDSKTVIDTTLFTILTENPEIIIEVSSHTDSKGSDVYNEKLSQARAESVVKYLISKGIDNKRLQAKGYGESKPLAPNEFEDGSDNEEGRAKNRRTEFRIIGIIEDVSGIIYEE